MCQCMSCQLWIELNTHTTFIGIAWVAYLKEFQSNIRWTMQSHSIYCGDLIKFVNSVDKNRPNRQIAMEMWNIWVDEGGRLDFSIGFSSEKATAKSSRTVCWNANNDVFQNNNNNSNNNKRGRWDTQPYL